MTKQKRVASKQAAFLAAYVRCGKVTKAAAAAKIDRSLPYRWLKTDEAYVEAFAETEEQVAQLLEDEAVRRAHDGVVEPVFYKGEKVGVIRRYSDGLLLALLKRFRPEKYRERGSMEVSAPGGGPVQIERIERVIVDPQNSDS